MAIEEGGARHVGRVHPAFSRRLAGIEGLRGVAIASVLLYHVWLISPPRRDPIHLGWLGTQVDRLATADHPTPSVLHLFAHTGMLSLGLARAGAAVVHVDSARTVVAWARRNAERSGLADRPIRWLVDDALAFVGREVRRGHRYDGIVLDPPSFGHAGRRRWRLADELPDLLAGCAALLDPNGFLLMTAHTTGLDGAGLGEAVRAVLPAGARHVTVEPLGLDATSGARLDLGWSVRLGAG